MRLPSTIGILVHERDPRARSLPYLIWPVADCWRKQGIDVRVLDGPADLQVDLVISHVDLTIMPPDYARALDAHPQVLNLAARDISKRAISSHLIRPDDDWDGPVIVKTDRNCGGRAERRSFRTPWWRRRGWAPTSMRPGAYPIFDSLRDVPRKVFSDSALVVERFLPERDGDRYVVHSYMFFGAHRHCHRKASLVPVVKGANVVERRAVPVHPEIEQQRRRLGLDFGKLDYVLHEGRPHLIDVNPTPAAASGLFSEEAADRAEARARALLEIEPRPTSLRTFPNG